MNELFIWQSVHQSVQWIKRSLVSLKDKLISVALHFTLTVSRKVLHFLRYIAIWRTILCFFGQRKKLWSIHNKRLMYNNHIFLLCLQKSYMWKINLYLPTSDSFPSRQCFRDLCFCAKYCMYNNALWNNGCRRSTCGQ